MILQAKYNFVERYLGQCCKEIELLWSPDNFNIAAIPFPSPVGKYTQQTSRSYGKAVYYNNASEYYIYNRGNEWIVSILTTLINVCSSNIIYKYHIVILHLRRQITCVIISRLDKRKANLPSFLQMQIVPILHVHSVRNAAIFGK